MRRRMFTVPSRLRRWVTPANAAEEAKRQFTLYCNLGLDAKCPLSWRERDFQSAVVRYIDTRHRGVGSLCFHVPLELLRRDDHSAGMFHALGARAGVADVVMLIPRGAYHGLVMELKVPPRRPTTAQCDFLEAARAQRYAACWTDSASTAYALIDAYLALPERALLSELNPPPIEEIPDEFCRPRHKANRSRKAAAQHADDAAAAANGAAPRGKPR